MLVVYGIVAVCARWTHQSAECASRFQGTGFHFDLNASSAPSYEHTRTRNETIPWKWN